MLSLQNSGMVTGDIIDAFSAILQHTFEQCCFSVPKPGAKIIIFNTYFFTKLVECERRGGGDYTDCDRWTKRISIERFDKLIIPINIVNTHWILATITSPHGIIEWHDSCNGRYDAYNSLLEKWLNDIKYRRYGITSWTYPLVEMPTPTQAPDTNDCGIYVMAAIYHQLRCRNDPLPPSNITDAVRGWFSWLIMRGGFGIESNHIASARRLEGTEEGPVGALPPMPL